MKNILKTSPFSRVNDDFNPNGEINSSPIGIVDYKHDLVKGAPNDKSTRYQANFYQNIAVDIVVETIFDYPYAYISEKTLRPIACKRMFILVGARHSLKLLHLRGFETFEDFIDESYDNIRDPIERFRAVEKEIKKVCNTPLSTIKAYMKKNSHKFESNFLLLQSLQDIELQEITKDHNIIL